MITYFDLVLSFSVLHLLSLHIAASFVKGTIDWKSLSACLPAIFHLRQKNRVILSGAAWRKEKSSGWFASSRSQHSSMSKGKGSIFSRLSPDRCCWRGDHTQQSGGWNTSCHTLYIIPLSRGSGAHTKLFLDFICSKKIFFFSLKFFLSMTFENTKSMLQWDELSLGYKSWA